MLRTNAAAYFDSPSVTKKKKFHNIFDLFALLFTNSEFYMDFHTTRKTLGKLAWRLNIGSIDI